MHDSGEWEPLRAAFVKNGYIVMSLNYSGSSGYGETYEAITSVDVQAKQLAMAVQYLRVHEKVSADRIILFGSSYGSRIVLRAIVRNSNISRELIFAPFLASPSDVAAVTETHYDGTVLAFHGEADPFVSPSLALRLIEQAFPKTVLNKRLHWTIFKNEGHGFNRLTSLQEELREVLSVEGK